MEDSKIIAAAKHYVRMQYPMGIDEEYPINDFINGAEWCINVVLEIINTNEDLANVWTTENLVKEIQSLKETI